MKGKELVWQRFLEAIRKADAEAYQISERNRKKLNEDISRIFRLNKKDVKKATEGLL